MNDIIVTIERSVFPLTKFFLIVGTERYTIKSGEIKKIKLPESGEYEIIASSYWIKKRVMQHLSNDSVIKVKHVIPDFFYLIGIPLIVLLSSLTFLGIVTATLLSVVLLLYFLPLMYFTFLKKSSYFNIKIE